MIWFFCDKHCGVVFLIHIWLKYVLYFINLYVYIIVTNPIQYSESWGSCLSSLDFVVLLWHIESKWSVLRLITHECYKPRITLNFRSALWKLISSLLLKTNWIIWISNFRWSGKRHMRSYTILKGEILLWNLF